MLYHHAPPPMGANSFFFILNLRLFSRKKQSKVTSLEREENTDMKPHLCNMCDETFTDLDSLITHKEEHKDRKPRKPLLCNMCGGTLMDADNFTTHKEEHRDISLSIVHDLPQSIPQPTILWWVPPDIQRDFPSDSLITHKEENTRISISSMVDKMNAFNACSLNYVAIQGKLIQAALLLLRALSHINVYDADGQNAVENHLANNMFVNKKLIKLLVIAGEKIGHSYPFRGPLLWICWLEGQSRVIPKCVYNIEKVISPGNHVIQL